LARTAAGALRRCFVLWTAALAVAAGPGVPPRATAADAAAALAAADGGAFGAPLPLRRCKAARGADLPAPLRRPGVTGRRCSLGPSLAFFVLSSDPASWPAVKRGGGPVLSLEDPVAKRLWIAGAGPVGVDFGQARLVVNRGARGSSPRAAYYSGLADRLDGAASVDAFVIVRLSPGVCLLGVVASEAEARRLAADEGSTCLHAVGGGGQRGERSAPGGATT
jgi:hypothetical protein